MKRATLFSVVAAVVLALPTSAIAQTEGDIEGRWEGTLEREGGAALTLVVDLERAEDGAIEARLRRSGPGPALDVPVDATFEDGVLVLVVQELAAGFGGTFAGPDRIAGLWQEGESRTPLEFRRTEEG